MLATSAARLPEGDQWSYEVKWDGYRTLAVKDGARVTLLSRTLKDATTQYPRVARAVGQIRDKPNGLATACSGIPSSPAYETTRTLAP
jgi:ATP-dependent DNA ligase